jgi:hypothetical protein
MLKRKTHTLTITYEHCPSKSEKHVFIYRWGRRERERERRKIDYEDSIWSCVLTQIITAISIVDKQTVTIRPAPIDLNIKE